MNEETINKFIGEKIKKYRKRDRLTQRDLAEKLGVTHSLISVYEGGKVSFSLTTLFRLSDIFGVSIDNFFPERNKKESDEINAVSFVIKEASTMDEKEIANYAKSLKLATEYHKSMQI